MVGGRKAGAKSVKYTCGNWQKPLGKGSHKHPSIWRNVCGCVHYKCSGLETVSEYSKNCDNFLCSKCTRMRRLVPANQKTVTYGKLHNLYTSGRNPAFWMPKITETTVKLYVPTTKSINFYDKVRPTQNPNRPTETSNDSNFNVTDTMKSGRLIWLTCRNSLNTTKA